MRKGKSCNNGLEDQENGYHKQMVDNDGIAVSFYFSQLQTPRSGKE